MVWITSAPTLTKLPPAHGRHCLEWFQQQVRRAAYRVCCDTCSTFHATHTLAILPIEQEHPILQQVYDNCVIILRNTRVTRAIIGCFGRVFSFCNLIGNVFKCKPLSLAPANAISLPMKLESGLLLRAFCRLEIYGASSVLELALSSHLRMNTYKVNFWALKTHLSKKRRQNDCQASHCGLLPRFSIYGTEASLEQSRAVVTVNPTVIIVFQP